MNHVVDQPLRDCRRRLEEPGQVATGDLDLSIVSATELERDALRKSNLENATQRVFVEVVTSAAVAHVVLTNDITMTSHAK